MTDTANVPLVATADEDVETEFVTATVAEDESVDTGLCAAFAEGNPWFPQLPTAQRTNVVKYAVLHIVNNSNLFQLIKHGGACQACERIAMDIARSGIEDAATIFIEAAATAREADAEDGLRGFFQRCKCADASTDGITVGTLFNAARQCGADFSRWEKSSNASGQEVRFVPGNEAECRRQLDRVVAADPRTFTLGDPTGPLVILRVPAKDTLPQETKWEGDLPGTTLATPADIMLRAERLKWMQSAGGKSETRIIRTGPQRAFVTDYIPHVRGQYAAAPLRGTVRVPRIVDTGQV